MRTKKTVDGWDYEYYYSDGLLVRQTYSVHGATDYIDFLYDESGTPYSFIYNGTQYYYIKNLQNDVIAIANTSGSIVVNYTYDAWGNILSITDTSNNSIGTINPIRYRSYYYDTDTGFYYLQSRYYDPAIRRFINADDISMLGANGDITSLNLYAYCGNNPVARADDGGEFWNIVIGATFGAAVGAVVSMVSQYVEDPDSIKTGEFWHHVATSAGIGAISGGLAASGVGLAGQIVVNSVLGGVGSIVDTAIDDDGNTSIETYVLNAIDGVVMGGISGLIGGKGTASKHVSNHFWRMLASGKDDLTYYFSQVGRQSVKDGVKSFTGIVKAAMPNISKIFIANMG